MDTRDVLPTVRCPTLVIHSTRDLLVPVEMGRYLAAHIPNATLLELDSDDHMAWMGDPQGIQDAVVEFLATVDPSVGQYTVTDRMLATVVFTDIVDSTVTATRLGDARWRHLLDEHDRIVAEQVARFGGRVVKTTGDGVLATFDGPGQAVTATIAIRDALQLIDVEIRAGVHTGEIEIRGDDVGGVAVHVAARVDGLAGPGEILATSTVRDLVAGSGIEFLDRGPHQLKGIDRTWDILEVTQGPLHRQ